MAKVRKASKVKNVLLGILLVLFILFMIAWVATLTAKLDRQTTTTRIGSEEYTRGTLDEKGEEEENKTAIYTKDPLKTEGMKIEVSDEAKVTYKLFFYDEEDNYLGQTGELTDDLLVSTVLPEGTAGVRIQITPTKDDEVSLFEVSKYANQITVTVDR